MTARGRGHLVNISSLAGVATFPGLATYGATKAGLTHFTSGLRADYGGPIGTLAVEMGRSTDDEPHLEPPTHGSGVRPGARPARPDHVGPRMPWHAPSSPPSRTRPRLTPRRAAPLATLAHAPRSVVRLALTGIR